MKKVVKMLERAEQVLNNSLAWVYENKSVRMMMVLVNGKNNGMSRIIISI